jgi:TonB-linked SusC/RagA family outer membrane protein
MAQRSRVLRFVLASILVVPLRIAAAQGGGTIAGTVTDARTHAPISEAQIAIVGTTRGARTGANGEYRLINVPPGTVQLRVLRISYRPQSQSVTVPPAGQVTADFALEPAAVNLDAVVTTATGEQIRQRETGNTVSTLRMDSLPKAAITNFSEALSSRAPGVTVQSASGTTGAGSRIRIRGSNSVSLANDPLLIVDGIRVNNDAKSTTIDIGGQGPSRFDDINPEDIETIDIIKGPAGVALYGTAAANGVIQVTTKRGRAGRTVWNAYTEGGTVRQPYSFPANFTRIGLDPSGARVRCSLDLEALGGCTPKPDSIYTFNPFTDPSSTPFVKGWRESYGLNAAGGSTAATYYLAGDFEREQGVFANNSRQRFNMRANVRGQLRENLDATVNVGYVQSRLRLPQNDNNDLGIVGNALLGSGIFNPETKGYAFFGPDVSNAVDTRQDVDRFTGGITSNWTPVSWLRATGIAGLDYAGRLDQQTLPPGIIPDPADLRATGNRQSNPYGLWNYTTNLNATATYGLASLSPRFANFSGSTSLGAQYENQTVHGTQAFGRGLTAGTGTLAGTTAGFAATEQNSSIVTLGGYAQQQISWRDRLFVTAGLRGDDNSAFGTNFKLIYYPTASVSWVVSDESFFPKNDVLSSLRLRGAAGQSGQRPGFRNAVTFYNAVGITTNASDVGGITLGGTGNSTLKPERSTEYEGGLDVGLFGARANLELTYYNKSTRDALIQRQLPPSSGGNTRFENLGQVTNKGFEGLLTATLLDMRQARLDLTVSGSHNNNRLVDLGNGISTIFFGLSGGAEPTQRFAAGYPVGGYWQRPILGFADKNGDGIISRAGCPDESTCEIQIGDTAVFLGSPIPKTEVSITPVATIFQWIRVNALFDRRAGYQLYNSTAQFRCAQFGRCPEANVPGSSLADQARLVASKEGTDGGYIENASFWKLREVAVTFTAPKSLASRIRIPGLALTIAGRNLKTWTKYKGFDPELNFNGPSNFSTADFFTQPPTRYWTTRLSANW